MINVLPGHHFPSWTHGQDRRLPSYTTWTQLFERKGKWGSIVLKEGKGIINNI